MVQGDMKAAVFLVSLLSLEACALCSAGEETVKFITADADAIQELLDADGSISEEDCRAVCEITSDVSNLTCYEVEANDDGTVEVICRWYTPCPRL